MQTHSFISAYKQISTLTRPQTNTHLHIHKQTPPHLHTQNKQTQTPTKHPHTLYTTPLHLITPPPPQVGSAYGGSTTLSGLQQYTRYEVVVQAFNNRGVGPLSPPVIATTEEDGEPVGGWWGLVVIDGD